MTSTLRRLAPEWRYAVSVVAVGSALTVTLGVALVRSEQDVADEALERRADRLAGEVERVVEGHTSVLYGIRSLYLTEGEVSRATFHRFVVDGGLIDRHPGAQAFEIARQVEAPDVVAFDQRVRADDSLVPTGYPDSAVHPSSVSRDTSAPATRNVWGSI